MERATAYPGSTTMMQHYRAIGRLVAASMLAAAAACGGDAANDTTMADTMGVGSPAAGGPAAGTAGAMDDAAIVAQMTGANSAEIAAGQMAAEKAQNADVRAFATQMVEDHQRMQGQVDSVVTTTSMAAPAVPDSMTRHMEDTRTRLQGQAAGAEFDRMYMEMQVTDHQNTLNALRAAQSAAQNAQLRTVIEGAIPAVEGHLERARTLVGTLGG